MADSKADAPFVFEGTVKSTSTSNVSAVPADKTTAIVQVDHVRLAPRALAGFAGKEVTVKTAPGETLSANERGVFFTDSLVFADQLAVQSLGHDPLAMTEAKAALAGASPVVQRVKRRLDQAQAVVTGEVTEVRPHEATGPVPAAAAAPEVISEHAPFWQDAVVNVT